MRNRRFAQASGATPPDQLFSDYPSVPMHPMIMGPQAYYGGGFYPQPMYPFAPHPQQAHFAPGIAPAQPQMAQPPQLRASPSPLDDLQVRLAIKLFALNYARSSSWITSWTWLGGWRGRTCRPMTLPTSRRAVWGGRGRPWTSRSCPCPPPSPWGNDFWDKVYLVIAIVAPWSCARSPWTTCPSRRRGVRGNNSNNSKSTLQPNPSRRSG